MPNTAIVLSAYGSPASDEGIEAYYTHIRGGRPPSPERLDELKARYRAIGGSPLLDITKQQAAALAESIGLPVYPGMKHSPPFVSDAIAEARAAGTRRLVSLPVAPHYARMSFAGYESPYAAQSDVTYVRGFHDRPAFIAAVREVLLESLAESRPERIFFTAHSLPERIVAEGDVYPDRLVESCRLVAEGLDLPTWSFAFQSASTTGEPWLGPDLLEAVADSDAADVLVCPIGFVADHLEILYDLDVEAAAWGREHGVRIRRTASLNTRPAFIAALRDAAESALVPANR